MIADTAHAAQPGDALGSLRSADPEERITVALSLGGNSRGPVLLVCGRRDICRPVFRRIVRLPSLPWMSGRLLLAFIGASEPDGPAAPGPELQALPFFDDSVFLDFVAAEGAARARYEQQAYWTILRKMAQVGMIAGRGVRQ